MLDQSTCTVYKVFSTWCHVIIPTLSKIRLTTKDVTEVTRRGLVQRMIHNQALVPRSLILNL